MTRRLSKAQLYATIRGDLRAGLSAREVQRRHHVTWRTVKAAEDSAWPQPRAAYPARGSKLDPFKPVIEEMLVADLDAPASSGTPRPGSSAGSSTSTS